MTTMSVYFGAIWLEKINDLFQSVKKVLDREQKKVFKEKLIWQKKMVVGLMLFVNLGTLAVLKYYNFFADVLNITLFHHIHKSLPF